MSKKDPIFWWATGIFVLGLVLFAVTQNQFWVALGIVAYLLRPTLASFGVARKHVEERQMSIYYRSGNIGFAVTMVMCVIYFAKLELENNHDFELFATVIVVGLAAKALFNVILAKNYREGASKILVGAGLLLALFSAADVGSLTGILLSIIPGLVVAGAGLLAKKYPVPAGIIALAAAAYMLMLIFTVGLENTGNLWSQMLVALVVGGPLVVAGVCLLSRGKREEDAQSEGTHVSRQ